MIFLRSMRNIQCSLEEGHWGDVRTQLKTNRGQENIQKNYYDVNSKQKVTALHLACRQGAPIDIVQEIMLYSPELSQRATEVGGDLPLHYAVASNRLNTVEALVNDCSLSNVSGAMRSSQRGAFGNQVTPLHVAMIYQVDIEIIELLIRVYPSIRNLRAGRGETAYRLAIEHYIGIDRERVLQLLQPPTCNNWELIKKLAIYCIQSAFVLHLLKSLVLIILHILESTYSLVMLLLWRGIIFLQRFVIIAPRIFNRLERLNSVDLQSSSDSSISFDLMGSTKSLASSKSHQSSSSKSLAGSYSAEASQ